MLLITSLIFILFQTTFCWWNQGHLLVAEVAKQILLKDLPESVDYIEELTKVLESQRHGKITNFVESATWPDLVKDYGLYISDNWHYYDVVYERKNKDLPNIDSNLLNTALALIKQATININNWTYEEAHNIKNQHEKSFMLSYLVHVVGDIHQPLHSCALVNNKFPKGDQGGNLFLIKVYNDNLNLYNQLHKLWDSGLSKLPSDAKLPLSKEDYKTLKETAFSYINEFPETELTELTKNTTPESWILESWSACKDVVYKNIRYGSIIRDNYLSKGYTLARKRIVLAGYRLSKLLKSSFSKYLEKKNDEKIINNFSYIEGR